MNGKWKASNERVVYDNWITVSLSDVELPDGSKIESHTVRAGKGGAGVLVHDPAKGVLLIWRHRIASDEWGWEIPAGRIEEGESPETTAAREVEEETGWRPGKLIPLLVAQPLNGFVDHPCHYFHTQEATWQGPAPDANEAADISWIPVPQIKEIMRKGEMTDGFTLNALLWAMTFGPLNA